MSFTYDPALVSDRDWVRFFVADRIQARAVLADEEIDALLTEEANKYLAAARAGEMMLARNGSLVDKWVGDLRLRFNDSPQSTYRNYLTGLRKRGCELLLPRNRAFKVL